MLIEKDNLTIRNAESGDAPQLGLWWRDGIVMAHAGFPNGLSITDDEIRRDIAAGTDDSGRVLIIEVNNIPIGEMNYRNEGNSTAEIGIKICDITMQGKGYGTRFLRMLICDLFENCGYEKIILDTNLSNVHAQHTYEKLGFVRVRERYDCWVDQLGNQQSAVDYELLKSTHS